MAQHQPRYAASRSSPTFALNSAPRQIRAMVSGPRCRYARPSAGGHANGSINPTLFGALPQGGQDHHRTVAQALQHDPPTQRPRMETAMPRNHHPDGPEADHALTFTSGHSVGADQAIWLSQSGCRESRHLSQASTRSFPSASEKSQQYLVRRDESEILDFGRRKDEPVERIAVRPGISRGLLRNRRRYRHRLDA